MKKKSLYIIIPVLVGTIIWAIFKQDRLSQNLNQTIIEDQNTNLIKRVGSKTAKYLGHKNIKKKEVTKTQKKWIEKGFTPEQAALIEKRLIDKELNQSHSKIINLESMDVTWNELSSKKVMIADNLFVQTRINADENADEVVGQFGRTHVIVRADEKPETGMWLIKRDKVRYGILTGQIKVFFKSFNNTDLEKLNELLGQRPVQTFAHLNLTFYKYSSLSEWDKFKEILNSQTFLSSFEAEVIENTYSVK